MNARWLARKLGILLGELGSKLWAWGFEPFMEAQAAEDKEAERIFWENYDWKWL